MFDGIRGTQARLFEVSPNQVGGEPAVEAQVPTESSVMTPSAGWHRRPAP